MAVAEERESRSVALETAYVHDVYDQISAHCSCCPATSCSCSSLQAEANGTSGRVWPRVRQFLQDLEPGSLVCDVGCGSGKYLHVNPDVFKVGADRCARLTELAREKEHEVMVCDNLALPFRDDSFDAVLSVAVVHHFATTERRVNALRELARVLRIGGRLLISVWAMEQRHRKFESQDVLVPWHRPQQQHLSTPSLELTSTATTCTTTSEEADAAGPPPYHAYTQTSDSDSARSVRVAGQQQPQQRKRGRSRHKGRSIDPARPSSSQSSSDLSSPNETCYSFVRRALQKLAGGRRGGSRHRAWFLDSWSACTKEPSGVAATELTSEGILTDAGRRSLGRDDSQEDVADALDLPIELRRLEDVEPSPNGKSITPPRRRRTLACGVPTPPKLEPTPLKSQSLGDILDTARPESLVRSRSSVARLPVVPSPAPSVETVNPTTTQVIPVTPGPSAPTSHPPLVRQKRSLCEDDEEGEEAAREAEDRPGPAPVRRADLRDLVRALPEVGAPRRGVPKQRSLNDELMATQRQREKDRVRQNITKQASLNEQLLSNSRGTLGSLKDSLLASPRFQQLRSGLTKLTSISASPADATKVASQSFKNGFVRMLQGWKGEAADAPTTPLLIPPTSPLRSPQPPMTPPPVSPLRRTADEDPVTGLAPIPSRCERRLSREEGSDSSKDSSLQSDTSVDSEDSFASVIFVPKPETKPDGPPALSPPTTEKSPPPNNIPPPPLPVPVSPIEKEIALEPTPQPKPNSPPMQPKTGTIRAETLKRIQQLLQERAPIRAPVFPLVRRSSAHPVGRPDQPLARPIPRLLSLELFNPETDDLDSDSSGVSSPDSVISVMEPAGRNSPLTMAATEKSAVPSPSCTSELEISEGLQMSESQSSSNNAKTSSLLEAAASVASSLEGAVDAVIQSSPRARRKIAAMGLRGSPSPPPPPVPPRPPLWDEECRQHLTEFADRLSEKLLEEIDRYSEICTIQSGSSRSSQFRTMARFPREHDHFSPEPCKLVEEEESEDVIRLDPERYLQDLQEINSDIGSQLAKLHEELDALPLNINVNHNNNNNSPRIQSPNNNNNSSQIKNINTEKVTNLMSPITNKSSPIELPDVNENNSKIDTKKSSLPVTVEVEVVAGGLAAVPAAPSVSPSQSTTGRSPKSPSSSLSGPEPPTRQVSWEESVGSPELRRDTSRDSGEEAVCKSKRKLTRQHASTTGWPDLETVPPKVTKTESYETSLSGSTSQDSLQSSSAGSGGPIGVGGSLTFHRYYHVFREGELDTLIDRYVENLHIISSYYDHANWCVIAEKVQVWTI